jgi:hypothetical protein
MGRAKAKMERCRTTGVQGDGVFLNRIRRAVAAIS